MKYIYNDPKDIELFEGIFGPHWLTVAALDPNLGAFLLFDSEQRAVTDENAARFFAVREGTPEYSSIRDMLTVTNGVAPDIEARLLPCGEGMTAGVVHLKELESLQALHCALSPQGRISAAAAQDPLSAIMMISVEGAEGSREMLDSCYFSAVNAIINSLPEGALMTRLSAHEFRIYLPSTAGDPEAAARALCESVSGCTLMNRYGTAISDRHPLSLSIGICAGDLMPAAKIHGSAFALYEAVSDSETAVKVFRPDSFEKGKDEYYRLIKLSQLIEGNLFVYHFQPIVSAHTGDIVAYEALMRSDPSIGYGPLEILDLAEKRGRLYDIELATLRNTLKVLSENQSLFDDRKMFINSIPSQLLSDEDFGAIISDYGELFEKTVVEFTERAEVSDSALASMKERIKRNRMGLAIDDYGTGYSNTTNLMRYSPDFVKIDRSLIADIDKKPKMQVLVSGIIDFVHSTGGMALAEGVETLEEVETMIKLSVDLLQGYYVSRPKPVLVNEISERIRDEIVKINLEVQGKIQKVYHAHDGDTLRLSELALDKYTEIFAEGGSITLIGEEGKYVRIPITVKRDAECTITLNSVYIETEIDVNVLTLSAGSKVRIICEAESVFRTGSVIVPETAELRISGLGSLSVFADSQDCCGIGSSHSEAFGDIYIDMDGRLKVSVNGVNGIGIGGGYGGSVNISAGVIEATVASINGVCIGSMTGTAKVDMQVCAVHIIANSTKAVCVGSLHGGADINIENVSFTCVCTGNILCSIGTLGSETARIRIRNAHLTTDLRGRTLVNIGTSGSVTDCEIYTAELQLYSEGSEVTGIGDKTGGGRIYIEDCTLQMTFLTGSCHLLGSPGGASDLVRVIKKIRLNE